MELKEKGVGDTSLGRSEKKNFIINKSEDVNDQTFSSIKARNMYT